MESKGEKAVELCLKNFNIEHIREFRLSPSLLRSDFFLPKLNIHIEFNGLQHYRPIDIFGGEEVYLRTKENDELKKLFIKARKEYLIVLTYLHLKSDSVEKELVMRLKQIYRYWFVVDGKLQVFRNALEVYDTFKLPSGVLVKDIVKELEKNINNFHVLF
jgi:hypothetical protein